MNRVSRSVVPAPATCDGISDVYGLEVASGWRINGHPARLLIWSAEEWEQLDIRPIDAQFHPFGVWCALRLVE